MRKKLIFLPLLALSLLTSCNNPATPPVTPQHEETGNYCLLTANSGDGKFIDSSTQKLLLTEKNSNIITALSSLVKPEFIETNDKIVYKFDKWVYEDGSDINVNDIIDSDTTVEATYTKKTLEECSWNEISRISNKGKEYAKNYFDDVSNGNSIEKSVTVNGQIHKVRIIGYGQDTDNNGNPIGITFEFANLISDSNGYSLVSYWNDTDNRDNANFDYLNSSVYRTLTNQGSSNLNWFQFYGIKEDNTNETLGTTSKNRYFTTDSIYSKKSIYDMLPVDLKEEIKLTKKTAEINDNGWKTSDYNDKLFLLSKKEIGFANGGELLQTYDFYNASSDKINSLRIKKQVYTGDEVRTDYLMGKDIDGKATVSKHIYAGYNKDNGAYYWLRSPHKDYTYMSYHITNAGNCDFYLSDCYAYGVAPAFCI